MGDTSTENDSTGDSANINSGTKMFSMSTLTKDATSLVPNIFNTLSIGITLLLIFYSNIDYKKRSVFCFINEIKDPCETKVKVDDTCPKDEEKLTTADYQFYELLAYVLGHAYKECLNATSQLINVFNDKIKLYQVFMIYIVFFVMNKFLKEFLEVFVPSKFLSKILTKLHSSQQDSSLIFDIFFSLFSMVSLLFIVCLLVSIVIYFAYIFNGLFRSSGRYVQLIPVFAFVILIIPLFPMIFSSKSLKKSKYYWLMVILITLGVPFIASMHTIGKVVVYGFYKWFTSKTLIKHAVVESVGPELKSPLHPENNSNSQAKKDDNSNSPNKNPPQESRGGSGFFPRMFSGTKVQPTSNANTPNENKSKAESKKLTLEQVEENKKYDQRRNIIKSGLIFSIVIFVLTGFVSALDAASSELGWKSTIKFVKKLRKFIEDPASK